MIKKFAAFWYDFLVGDDPVVAVGVVIALCVTAVLAHHDLTSWWLLPVATAILLTASLLRAVRSIRSGDR